MLTGVCVSVSQLVEAIVLPMTHKERFENLGIQPPKGLLFSLLDLSHFSESNSTSCKVLYKQYARCAPHLWKNSPRLDYLWCLHDLLIKGTNNLSTPIKRKQMKTNTHAIEEHRQG